MCIDRKREALIKVVDREFYIFFRREGMWRSLDTRNPIENKEKYIEYNQWFIDRKIGGSAYDNYIEDAIRNANSNQKLLEELGAKFQDKCI